MAGDQIDGLNVMILSHNTFLSFIKNEKKSKQNSFNKKTHRFVETIVFIEPMCNFS